MSEEQKQAKKYGQDRYSKMKKKIKLNYKNELLLV